MEHKSQDSELEMADTYEPHYMTGRSKTLKMRFAVNKDHHTPPKTIRCNLKYYRSYSKFLDFLTEKLKPSFGAVRKVCVHRRKHTVQRFEDFNEDELYLACQSENSQDTEFNYGEIGESSRKPGRKPNYDALPVIHNQRLLLSARYRKADTHGKVITCYVNGRKGDPGHQVKLNWKKPWTLNSVLEQVDEVVNQFLRKKVIKLFRFPDGTEVTAMDEIVNHDKYVASDSEHYVRTEFGEDPKNFVFGGGSSPNTSRDSSPPRRYGPSNKNSSHSSPEYSYASNNGYRRNKERREGEPFARPMKHKRSSEKTRQADYDQDQGGVFKAKSKNQHTRGARQIDDSRQTRTEVPLDQQKAEEVKEERIQGKADKEGKKNKKDEERTYRANSRRPGQALDEQAEKDARALRAEEDRKRAEKAQEERAAMYRKRKEQQNKKEEEKRKEREHQEERRRERDDKERKGKTTSTPESKNKVRKDNSDNQRVTPTPEASPIANNNGYGREEELAAAKIQAGYRGQKVRREMKQHRAEQARQHAQDDLDRFEKEREMQEHEAASRIQAGFRGYQVRRDNARQRAERQEADSEREWRRQEDERREMDLAAARIQAGYRGHRTRRELREQHAAAQEDTYRQDSSLLRDDPLPVQADDDWGPEPGQGEG